MFEYKSISAESSIKDIDEKAGRVTGYFSVFGNKDSDGDMVMPGAYKKSLAEMGSRVLHLYQHDPMRPLSSAKSGRLILKEDAHGLHFDSTITPTTWGQDVIKLIADGVLSENSVGFVTVKSLSRKSYRELVELKLFEGSSVSWGSNEYALNTKSELTEDILKKKMETVLKSLRNGTYTDDTFDQLEIYLLQLNQAFLDMKSTQPDLQKSVEPEVDEDLVLEIKELNKLFKQN